MAAYYTVMGAFALVGLVIAAFAVMPGTEDYKKDVGYVREDQKRGILEPETVYEIKKEKDHETA